jgi:hypothetical protein
MKDSNDIAVNGEQDAKVAVQQLADLFGERVIFRGSWAPARELT